MAHTKSAGATKLGRDSRPKYLGVKLYDGQKVNVGGVLVRQRGMEIYPGKNVKAGKDYTLYALKSGVVKFSSKQKVSFSGKKRRVKVVNV